MFGRVRSCRMEIGLLLRCVYWILKYFVVVTCGSNTYIVYKTNTQWQGNHLFGVRPDAFFSLYNWFRVSRVVDGGTHPIEGRPFSTCFATFHRHTKKTIGSDTNADVQPTNVRIILHRGSFKIHAVCCSDMSGQLMGFQFYIASAYLPADTDAHTHTHIKRKQQHALRKW